MTRSVQSIDGQIILSPSDLTDYVQCPHVTTLALQVARGQRPRSYVTGAENELLRRKGEAHERAHLERLQGEGRTIIEIGLDVPWDCEAGAHRTAEAMRAGADAISQATSTRVVAPQWPPDWRDLALLRHTATGPIGRRRFG
jgi:uncharacterized protein